MADEEPNFITQVKRPNEAENKHVAEQQQQQQLLQPQNNNNNNNNNNNEQTDVKPKKKSCYICCGGGGENGQTTTAGASDAGTAGDAKTGHPVGGTAGGGVVKIPLNTAGAGTGTGTAGNAQTNGNDYSLFNSPRASGKYGGVAGQAAQNDDHLLPPQNDNKKGKKCLVLDLDETLVHSSFKQVSCDFIVPVKIEDKTYKVFVAKRPHVDQFLKRCGELYEIVIFTASLAQYADPVVDLLDIHKVVDWRLFRESCTPYKGAYVKDMGRMGRDISQIMIIDNSPHSYLFNRDNAFPCETWYDERTDHELLDFIQILEKLAEPEVTDVRQALRELNISPLEADEDGLQSSQEDSEEGSQYSGTDTGTGDSEGTGTSEYTQSEQGEQKT